MLGQVQQALGFAEEPLQVGEGAVGDILPSHLARGIDEKCAVERLAFEVVEGSVGFEGIEFVIAHDRVASDTPQCRGAFTLARGD